MIRFIDRWFIKQPLVRRYVTHFLAGNRPKEVSLLTSLNGYNKPPAHDSTIFNAFQSSLWTEWYFAICVAGRKNRMFIDCSENR
jgi:hypothetical protein